MAPYIGTATSRVDGVAKVTVETMAPNEGGQAMFVALGFDVEAVLRGQVLDRDGNRQDVVILSRWIDDSAG